MDIRGIAIDLANQDFVNKVKAKLARLREAAQKAAQDKANPPEEETE